MSDRTQICVSIPASTQEAMLGEMMRHSPEADLLELRIDEMTSVDLRQLLDARTRPVIVTNRPERERGKFAGAEAERIALLQQAVDLGAEYVDIELDAAGAIERRGKTQVIVSYHNFDETPENLDDVYRRILDTGPDIIKIAVTANDIRDNLRIFGLMRRSTKPIIALCMGELGQVSRILAPRFGGYLMFASVGAGRESGPGQLTAAELRRVYRFDRIGPGTAIYGLIADPVAHSMSPTIHNAAFDALAVDAVYVSFRVKRDPAVFVRDMLGLGAKGFSVSIPHKEAMLGIADDIESLAGRIGALNTLVEREGRLYGANTDYSGALAPLEEALRGKGGLTGKRLAILGAGGAARALAFGATDRGAEVTICNRTHERGVRLAREVGCEAHPLEAFAALDPPDVLINTTPIGMWPDVDDTPVPAEALDPMTFVYDCIFNPMETRLLREAKAAGCWTLGGVDWFIGQGAAQFELWTGQRAPRDVMRRAMVDRLQAAP